MIRVLTGLPMWLQATGSAIAAGLLLGLLVGALLSGGSSAGGGVTVQDPWQQRQLDVGELSRCLYEYADAEAATHLFRVSSGIDSLVIGESQILK